MLTKTDDPAQGSYQVDLSDCATCGYKKWQHDPTQNCATCDGFISSQSPAEIDMKGRIHNLELRNSALLEQRNALIKEVQTLRDELGISRSQVEQLNGLSATQSICFDRAARARDRLQEEVKQLRDLVEQLTEALRKIAAIENKEFGLDWEEIEEARHIANSSIPSTDRQ